MSEQLPTLAEAQREHFIDGGWAYRPSSTYPGGEYHIEQEKDGQKITGTAGLAEDGTVMEIRMHPSLASWVFTFLSGADSDVEPEEPERKPDSFELAFVYREVEFRTYGEFATAKAAREFIESCPFFPDCSEVEIQGVHHYPIGDKRKK